MSEQNKGAEKAPDINPSNEHESVGDPGSSQSKTFEDQKKEDSNSDNEQSAIEKRIHQITARAQKAEEKAKSYRVQYEEALAKLETIAKPHDLSVEKDVDKDAPKAPSEPVLSDFDNEAAYAKAMSDFTLASVRYERDLSAYNDRKKAQAQSMSQAQHYWQQKYNEFDTNLQKIAVKYEDFEEAYNNLNNIDVYSNNLETVGALIEHPDSGELIYYLGKNIDIAKKLTQLPPRQAILELGKIASQLTMRSAESTTSDDPGTPTTIRDHHSSEKANNRSFKELRKKVKY